MVGSVFNQEMLLSTRRSRWHYFRWLYAGLLVLEFVLYLFIVSVSQPSSGNGSFTALSIFSSEFTQFFCSQHFLLLLLITPILTAGAITDEKTRGTLQYLLVADLKSWEILLGKLFARSYQGILLFLVGLPLLCFTCGFLGRGYILIPIIILCTLVLLFAIGSLSLLVSVWSKETRDAVIVVYALGLMIVLAFLIPGVRGFLGGIEKFFGGNLSLLDPLSPAMAISDPGELWRRVLGFAVFWSGVGLICLTIAGFSLRWVYFRQLQARQKKPLIRLWRRPPVSNSPITWKERYVEGISPLGVLKRFPIWFGMLVVFAATILGSGWILIYRLPSGESVESLLERIVAGDLAGLLSVFSSMRPSDSAFYQQGLVLLQITGFIVGVRCSGTISKEREKGTWDSLLLTPLSTKEIVRGKLWGIAMACIPFFVAYSLPALFLSLLGGPKSLMWTILWLMATILAVFYVGSAGMWCSARAKSSWRSLLGTLAFIYLGGLVLHCWLMIFTGCFTLLIIAFFLACEYFLRSANIQITQPLAGFWDAYWIAFCLLMAGSFAFISWRLLIGTESRISSMERVRERKIRRRFNRRGR